MCHIHFWQNRLLLTNYIIYPIILGESVEENANLVVRLLIRRPECLGPALRGEGGGLLKAIKDGIRMSEQISAARDGTSGSFLTAMNDDDDSDGRYLHQTWVFTRINVAYGCHFTEFSRKELSVVNVFTTCNHDNFNSFWSSKKCSYCIWK